MTNQETPKIDIALDQFNAVLEKKHEHISTNGAKWYIISDNHLVCASKIFNGKCLVIEHAESKSTLYGAEDGDLFYPEDFNTVDDRVEAMRREVYED